MSDFYTRLKQSILERNISDPAARQTVYEQARRAVIRQLSSRQPPLMEDEIDRRLAAFETSIERMENDLAAEFALARPEYPDDADAFRPHPSPYAAEPQEDAPPVPDWYASDRRADTGGHVDDDAGAATPVGRGPASYAKDPYQPRPPRHPFPDEDDTREAPQRGRDRWRPDPGEERYAASGTRLPPARPRPASRFSEQTKVRLLLGTIGVLAIVLVAFVIYLLLPAGESGVTVPVGTQREVSDAATATRIPSEQFDVRRTFVVFDGSDPTIFDTAPDNPVRFDRDDQGAFSRIASSTDATGVKVAIGPGLADELAGQRIRVVITARSSAERGAASMRFAYQSGLALSHWQTAGLLPNYADVGLVWPVPGMRTSRDGNDYLIIEPGIPGDGTAADIRTIRIDLLAPSA